MAKKSAISGEYVIQVKDDGGIEVYRIFDNVKAGLCEVAEAVGFEYDAAWNTRQLGAKLIKEFGDGKSLTTDVYVVSVRLDGGVDIYKNYSNVKAALREVSASVNFEVDAKWTTRQFGSKLIDFLLSGK